VQFDFGSSLPRYSNTEKRTSKFDPLSSLKLLKSNKGADIDMDMEETNSDTKTEAKNVVEESKNNFGNICSLFKPNNKNKESQHMGPFDNCESEGLRLQRTSNIS